MTIQIVNSVAGYTPRAQYVIVGAWTGATGSTTVANDGNYNPITWSTAFPDKFGYRNADKVNIDVPSWAKRYRVTARLALDFSGITVSAGEQIILRHELGTSTPTYTGSSPLVYVPYNITPSSSQFDMFYATQWRTINPATSIYIRFTVYSTLNGGVSTTAIASPTTANDRNQWLIEFMENSTDG